MGFVGTLTWGRGFVTEVKLPAGMGWVDAGPGLSGPKILPSLPTQNL